jgi:hypothetical protein
MGVLILNADCTRLPLPDQSVDLVLGSPPYCDARTYDDGTLPAGHVVSRDCAAWVDWMLDVTTEALRVSRGAVVWVATGVTRDRNYWPACEGLMWEWFKRGGSMYRPCYWYRVGVPGSGGNQAFRADVEYCMVFKRPGVLPWTDNTAMGHPPKWAPGGAMSHRVSDGTRVNQWGKPGSKTGTVANGNKEKPTTGAPRPSHKSHTKREADGTLREQHYGPPVLANPGTALNAVWGEADETFWLDVKVGGGQMGDRICHQNEAPYPERLAEWWIRSLCPPGGTVLDCFSGSGTTAKVATKHGRRAIASDLRMSQCELTRRRCASVQRELFVA